MPTYRPTNPSGSATGRPAGQGLTGSEDTRFRVGRGGGTYRYTHGKDSVNVFIEDANSKKCLVLLTDTGCFAVFGYADMLRIYELVDSAALVVDGARLDDKKLGIFRASNAGGLTRNKKDGSLVAISSFTVPSGYQVKGLAVYHPTTYYILQVKTELSIVDNDQMGQDYSVTKITVDQDTHAVDEVVAGSGTILFRFYDGFEGTRNRDHFYSHDSCCYSVSDAGFKIQTQYVRNRAVGGLWDAKRYLINFAGGISEIETPPAESATSNSSSSNPYAGKISDYMEVSYGYTHALENLPPGVTSYTTYADGVYTDIGCYGTLERTYYVYEYSALIATDHSLYSVGGASASQMDSAGTACNVSHSVSVPTIVSGKSQAVGCQYTYSLGYGTNSTTSVSPGAKTVGGYESSPINPGLFPDLTRPSFYSMAYSMSSSYTEWTDRVYSAGSDVFTLSFHYQDDTTLAGSKTGAVSLFTYLEAGAIQRVYTQNWYGDCGGGQFVNGVTHYPGYLGGLRQYTELTTTNIAALPVTTTSETYSATQTETKETAIVYAEGKRKAKMAYEKLTQSASYSGSWEFSATLVISIYGFELFSLTASNSYGGLASPATSVDFTCLSQFDVFDMVTDPAHTPNGPAGGLLYATKLKKPVSLELDNNGQPGLVSANNWTYYLNSIELPVSVGSYITAAIPAYIDKQNLGAKVYPS